MNLTQMISDLRAERDSLTAAMAVLEGLALGRVKRRGRPPAWLASLPGAKKKAATTRTMSEATRKKMARAQRMRWAAV
jgi:hypothetical protein